MLVWPVYPWLGNHIEPRMLGLPWSLSYVLLVITANFAVLMLLYATRLLESEADRRGERVEQTQAREQARDD